ncbi:hypothetical protein RIF29_20445 [Crotalaria pallida]|uniref:Uncharacterized protein n=1 Tax=Crotalaria pallida TaxID=3830 RepID=A0AAN9F4I5_CROPI
MMKPFRCETFEMTRELANMDEMTLHSNTPTTTSNNNLPHQQMDDACGGISDKRRRRRVTSSSTTYDEAFQRCYENKKYDHFITELASSHHTLSRSLSPSSMVEEHTRLDVPVQNYLSWDIATQQQQQGLQQEEQATVPQIDLNPQSTSNNFFSSQQRMNGRRISDINKEKEVGESSLMDYFNSIPTLSDSELEHIQFSLLLNDLLADD